MLDHKNADDALGEAEIDLSTDRRSSGNFAFVKAKIHHLETQLYTKDVFAYAYDCFIRDNNRSFGEDSDILGDSIVTADTPGCFTVMNKFRPSKSVDGLPQSATGVEQGGPDSLNHNSEKSGKIEVDDPLKLCAPKCVDGPPQSATGVEQGEADTEVQVDHNSGRKMKRDEGTIDFVGMKMITNYAAKYSSPQSKRSRILSQFLISWCLLVIPITGSSGGVQVLTGPTVSYVGARGTFHCSDGRDIVSVQWLLNGTLDDGLNMNVVSEFSQISLISNLLIRDVPMEYNGTTIQCRANSSSGDIIYSNNITMLVQGPLSAVGDLSAIALDSTISLTWNPPFTLDITNVDPDITYRVDMINSTSSQVIHSQGGITITQYNYTTSLSPERRACDVFKFTITPVNIVGNGDNSSISKGFLNVVPSVLSRHANASFLFHIRMSAMVCEVNVMKISVLNRTNEVTNVQDVIVTVNDSDRTILEITGSSLKPNRHYNVTLNVSNSAGLETLNLNLSTYDVQRTDMENSTVNIFYAENTEAKGALCILISIHNGHVDFNSSVFVFIRRNEELPISMPLNFRPGQYDVISYDVESNGRLQPGVGYPAYVQKINNTQTGSVSILRSPHLENCGVSHSTESGNILASCEFPSTSMASGFQMILQFNDPAIVESVQRVMVGETLDRNISVSLNVSRSGTYCAIIFAIVNGTILKFPSYSNEFTVNIQGTDQDGMETFLPVTRTMPEDPLIGILIPVVVMVLVLIGIIITGLYCFVRRKIKIGIKECDATEESGNATCVSLKNHPGDTNLEMCEKEDTPPPVPIFMESAQEETVSDANKQEQLDDSVIVPIKQEEKIEIGTNSRTYTENVTYENATSSLQPNTNTTAFVNQFGETLPFDKGQQNETGNIHTEPNYDEETKDREGKVEIGTDSSTYTENAIYESATPSNNTADTVNHYAETQPFNKGQQTQVINIHDGLNYSDVGWSMNEDGIKYSHVVPKMKSSVSTHDDSSKVVYSSIKKEEHSSAPRIVHCVQ